MITLRSASPEDEEFLHQLYASTRAEEVALFGWDAAQAAAFLQMQFRAQTQSYRLQFPAAATQIVLEDGAAIGRLVTHRTAAEILLLDIALLPAWRKRGIGTQLIQSLQAEAAQAGIGVQLFVQATNRSQHLYQRLGFVPVDEPGVYLEMRWQPAHQPARQGTTHDQESAASLSFQPGAAQG